MHYTDQDGSFEAIRCSWNLCAARDETPVNFISLLRPQPSCCTLPATVNQLNAFQMTPDDFAKARSDAMSPAPEVIEHLYRVLTSAPPFKLKDGTECRFDPYVNPDLDEDGQAKCEVDVLLGDAGHLEFTIKNTGWGKGFAATLDRQGGNNSSRGR